MIPSCLTCSAKELTFYILDCFHICGTPSSYNSYCLAKRDCGVRIRIPHSRVRCCMLDVQAKRLSMCNVDSNLYIVRPPICSTMIPLGVCCPPASWVWLSSVLAQTVEQDFHQPLWCILLILIPSNWLRSLLLLWTPKLRLFAANLSDIGVSLSPGLTQLPSPLILLMYITAMSYWAVTSWLGMNCTTSGGAPTAF